MKRLARPDPAVLHWPGRSLLLLPVVLLVGGWLVAQASEKRTMLLVVARLAQGLSSQSAEQLLPARGAMGQGGNPFLLLPVTPENYCGELGARQRPRAGCWYFRPEQNQVLYQVRFAWPGTRKDAVEHVWQVRYLPAQPGARPALELQEVDD